MIFLSTSHFLFLLLGTTNWSFHPIPPIPPYLIRTIASEDREEEPIAHTFLI
jgi:hypothetical protein